ncbi:MAG: hypothetical protein BGO98_41390 [Myxococcales bacterium 68-20]|nr:MAG: hypothetical protein BGO98_41390 [Myxococcales bacterium 68-20]
MAELPEASGSGSDDGVTSAISGSRCAISSRRSRSAERRSPRRASPSFARVDLAAHRYLHQ